MSDLRTHIRLVEEAMRQVPHRLYHVVGDDYEDGDPLQSLYQRFGNEAYDIFADRWGEGQLGHYHANYVFFYDSLEKAREHEDMYGGRILEVDPKMLDYLHFDTLEPPGYWTSRSEVPVEAIVRTVR